MRIALTCPTYWPYGRRGERYINGLAGYLLGKGHQVTIVTSKPGRPRMVRKEELTILYNRDYSSPLLSYRRRYHLFAWLTFKSLLAERFDVIQSLFYTDVFGAGLSRPWSRSKIVYYIPNGTPFHFDGALDSFMYRTALRSASLLTPSLYLRDQVKEKFGYDSPVIYPGTDTDYFRPGGKKDLDRPRILCMGDLVDPRKRTLLLVKAFERLKGYEPDAILQLSGRVQQPLPRIISEIVRPEVRESIQVVGIGKEADVPDLYAQAAMTVLPALHEAFGMVLVESLASGTPVVGTRDGGIPEIINDPRIGVMFEGDGEEAIDSLCQAMVSGLDLARNPATSARCRERSKAYDWSAIGPQLESLYQNL